VTSENQALYLNAVPLLVLGGLYLLAAATLAPLAWRERRRIGELEFTLALVFPAGGIAATIFGLAILADPEPVGGNPLLGLAAALFAGVPVLLYFSRWRDRALLLTGARRAREAEERQTEQEQRREQIDALTSALAHVEDEHQLAALVSERAARLLGCDFAALASIEEGGARGVAAWQDGAEADWWPEIWIDFETEPSAIASVAFEAAPLAIYDVASSLQVNRRLADKVGAASVAFAPAIAATRVVAVLVAATTHERHAFSRDEMTLLQELGAESALALERVRSASELQAALERERLVARISQRLRSAFDVDALLAVAVFEVGQALGVNRCFVRLGEQPDEMAIASEWLGAGEGPIEDRTVQLPVSNLAVVERRTVAVSDIEAEPGLDAHAPQGREGLRRLGSRAVLATPILVFDEVIGALAAHAGEPRDWTRGDTSLLEAVAHEVGLALNSVRLLDENRRRVAQQAALVKAGEALSAELELDSVINRLVEEALPLVGADAADCWLLEDDRRMLRCRAVRGLPATEVGRTIAPEGTMAEAIATEAPVLKRDFAGTEQPPPSPSYREFAETMDAPIVSGGEVRGVLGVCSRQPGRFDQRDLELLEALARLAALALGNAEAFAERSRQARVQKGFYRIASVLGEPLSLANALDAAAQAASEALGGDFAAVLALRGTTLSLAGSEGLPPELERALGHGVAAEDEPALHAAAVDERVLAVPLVARDERFGEAWRGLARRAGYGSLLAIPVPGDETALVLVFFADERRFSDDDLELARHLAGAARASLERSALFEEERTARSLAQQLARTGALLASELDPAAVLEAVARAAPEVVGADACAIRTLEDDELVVAALAGVADDLVGTRAPSNDRLSGDVAESRGPVAKADTAYDERLADADPVLAGGFRAYLGVPLTGVQGGLTGVLSLYSREPRTWRAEEIEAVRALALNASAALANAELYQRVAIEKERSFAILSNIADGIVAVDRDGHVVLWNAAAEEITGVPAREAVGRRPVQVLGRDLEETGAGPRDRLVSILRGGDEVWLSLTEAVMRDPAGAVSGRIYAFRDISADRLVEQMKSEFVSTVSQELRRPLTSIYGFAETLLREDVLFGEPERRTFLRYIASESERLTTIVDALLNVARLDSGDLQIAVAPTDVGSAVADVVGDAGDDGHEFVVDLPSEPLAAAADPQKLRQVLVNLVENAIRYSPGGGTVRVAARRRDDRVEISVADEGVGVPQAEQERIFRKFYRADPAGGTGLGLFIVRGLVNAMGGRIWVTSPGEGKGASFTFELPAAAGKTESESERV
jgi:PAS domain S-box-containing protein